MLAETIAKKENRIVELMADFQRLSRQMLIVGNEATKQSFENIRLRAALWVILGSTHEQETRDCAYRALEGGNETS